MGEDRSLSGRSLRTVCGAALVFVMAVAAACAPPTPPPVTLAPGVFNIEKENVGRWQVGVPVDLTLGVLGTGGGTVFTVGPINYEGADFGGLPVGVELVGNRLVGTPERRGWWVATVTATGTRGTKTANLYGYVVGEYPISPTAPQITPGVLTAPLLTSGSVDSESPREFWVYEPGSTSPRGVLEASGQAFNPDPSEGYGLFEELVIGNLRSGTFWSNAGVDTCSIELVPILNPFVGSSVTLADTAPTAECPTVRYSEDGSTVLTVSTTPNAGSTPIHRFSFYRTTDGTLIRSTTRTSSWISEPVLAADGSKAVVTLADNELLAGSVTEVIGAKSNADLLFVLSDDNGRKCRVGSPFGSIRQGSVAIACRYPDGSAVGSLNLATSELWLSAKRTLFVESPSLSPNGDQLLFISAQFPLPPPTWPFGPIPLWISVTNVGGDGSIQQLMPLPGNFGGFLWFTPP
jgi:hypothetical protein